MKLYESFTKELKEANKDKPYSKEDKLKLKEIYDNLQKGVRYGYDMKNVTYPVFNWVLCKGTSEGKNDYGKDYIYWRNYGSSANKNTVEDLKWVLDTIFEMTPTEFLQKYIKDTDSTIKESEGTADDNYRGKDFWEYNDLYLDGSITEKELAESLLELFKTHSGAVKAFKEITDGKDFPLKEAEVKSEDTGIVELSAEEVTKYVDDWCTGNTPDERGDGRYYCKNADGSYTAIDNRSGNCWTEDFKTKEEVVAWLNDEFEVSDKLKESDESSYEEIDSKSIQDFDGFTTDYTLYKCPDGTYATVFGDKDVYRPEDADFDMTFDNEKEAKEWFNSYSTEDMQESQKLKEADYALEKDPLKRLKNVYLMDRIIRGMNNEDALDYSGWLYTVEDESTDEGFEAFKANSESFDQDGTYYYTDDETYKDLCKEYKEILKDYAEDGFLTREYFKNHRKGFNWKWNAGLTDEEIAFLKKDIPNPVLYNR